MATSSSSLISPRASSSKRTRSATSSASTLSATAPSSSLPLSPAFVFPVTKKARKTVTKAATAPPLAALVPAPRASTAPMEFDGPVMASSTSTAATVLPAVLAWDVEEAKAHLISADPRFATYFDKWKPTIYSEDKEIDAWRSLVHSLLGQQISWLAARSITHRFIRIFFPTELPALHDPLLADSYAHIFPSPGQILALPSATRTATLRAAGLSGRKAEYVESLAEKFESGELSSKVLLDLDDEELGKKLLALKGVGPWTINMFSMFSLRRPNVLPVGDLGVQKGLLKHALSSHVLTPSASTSPLRLLPTGLTLPQLRARLNVKAKGGKYLSEKEMEDLTSTWAPYRTLGTWYMWKVCGSEGDELVSSSTAREEGGSGTAV